MNILKWMSITFVVVLIIGVLNGGGHKKETSATAGQEVQKTTAADAQTPDRSAQNWPGPFPIQADAQAAAEQEPLPSTPAVNEVSLKRTKPAKGVTAEELEHDIPIVITARSMMMRNEDEFVAAEQAYFEDIKKAVVSKKKKNSALDADIKAHFAKMVSLLPRTQEIEIPIMLNKSVQKNIDAFVIAHKKWGQAQAKKLQFFTHADLEGAAAAGQQVDAAAYEEAAALVEAYITLGIKPE